MPRKREDAEDFERLQKLGFTFSERGEHNAQPASGGAIEGARGVQEYGIDGDIATEDLETEIDSADDDLMEVSLEDVALVDVDEEELGGTSEWSSENATDEDEVIEEHLRQLAHRDDRAFKKSEKKQQKRVDKP